MIYIGCDPGVTGAIAVIEQDKSVKIIDAPTLKTKTGKKDYDVRMMAKVLHDYAGADVTAIIEAVHAMPKNGSVSSFHFGRGKGLWEGIMAAYDWKVEMCPPQTWKKHYPVLIADKIPSKETKGKTAKEKKEIARDIAKQRRIAKAAAKAKARELAAQFYPELADSFKTVNSDGRAEALLMARYLKEKFEEAQHASE